MGVLLADFSGDFFEVVNLLVDPNYRRNGFGSMLLERAQLLNGKKVGLGQVIAYVSLDDKPTL